MSLWRGFIITACIALFAAIISPAYGTQSTFSQLTSSDSHFLLAQGDENTHNAFKPQPSPNLSLTQAFASSTSPCKADEDAHQGNKKPRVDISVSHDVTLPPIERQAASAFGSALQITPEYVLAYEFLPEILGSRYYLAPLSPSNLLPWYARPHVTSNHRRLAGWKDSNILYKGALPYLS